MDDISSHSTGHAPTNYLSFVLWSLAGIFQLLQSCTAEDVWVWLFRILSLISVVLVIIINLPKAKEVILKNNERIRKKK